MLRRTALHWSCKQGHTALVQYLLQSGADPNIRTDKGELPASLTDKEDILDLLPRLDEPTKHQGALPIIPHFMINPPFPYKDMTRAAVVSAGSLGGDQQHDTSDNTGCITDRLSSMKLGSHEQNRSIIDQGLEGNSVNTCRADVQQGLCTDVEKGSLLVKVRVADSDEKDFVEVDVENMTYVSLLHACCLELGLKDSQVVKIRKLPNVLVRKNKDVQRLNQGQEIELVLAPA